MSQNLFSQKTKKINKSQDYLKHFKSSSPQKKTLYEAITPILKQSETFQLEKKTPVQSETSPHLWYKDTS